MRYCKTKKNWIPNQGRFTVNRFEENLLRTDCCPENVLRKLVRVFTEISCPRKHSLLIQNARGLKL